MIEADVVDSTAFSGASSTLTVGLVGGGSIVGVDSAGLFLEFTLAAVFFYVGFDFGVGKEGVSMC